MIISVFIPHGGCPERCAFCDQAVSGGDPASSRRVREVIEAHLAGGATATEIAFYGGTFTALAPERQLAYLEAARPELESGRIEGVRLATRPDAVDEQWLKRLRDTYRLKTVELGAQSFSDQVLKALGRSHSPEDTRAAVATLKRLGLRSGLHLLLGCPGEESGDDALNLEWALKLRPDTVRIHPLLVLKGTALEKRAASGEFEPLSLELAIERAVWLTRRLEREGVKVIRLGLQPNELLGAAVVAGPYHPAFGDLVRGRLLRDAVADRLAPLCNRDAPVVQAAQIRLPERFSGSFRGPGGANLKWLKDRFNLSTIELDVLKGGSHSSYDDVEVRIHHTPGTAQCGQVEPAQPPGR